MVRCNMGFLVAIAWIVAIVDVGVNIAADIWFCLWTVGCNNLSHNTRIPRGPQQNKHKHGRCLRPDHGFIHMLRRAYGQFSLRRRYSDSYVILQVRVDLCTLYISGLDCATECSATDAWLTRIC
ncbi:hypothetical protein BDR07DRAFT_676281 [Suillus spraguei]|nr:hypothetical protein BDR07DRAFT_676281 [Suillus spraguei]